MTETVIPIQSLKELIFLRHAIYQPGASRPDKVLVPKIVHGLAKPWLIEALELKGVIVEIVNEHPERLAYCMNCYEVYPLDDLIEYARVLRCTDCDHAIRNRSIV